MKKQLASIAPLKAGIVLAVFYGLVSVLFVPIFLVAAFVATRNGNAAPGIFGLGFAVLMPIFYAVAGFIGGLVGAAVYNLIASWTGGFEFQVRDVPSN